MANNPQSLFYPTDVMGHKDSTTNLAPTDYVAHLATVTFTSY